MYLVNILKSTRFSSGGQLLFYISLIEKTSGLVIVIIKLVNG